MAEIGDTEYPEEADGYVTANEMKGLRANAAIIRNDRNHQRTQQH